MEGTRERKGQGKGREKERDKGKGGRREGIKEGKGRN